MSKFRITSKEKFGDMPKGTTLIVDTPLSSCDPDKIKAAVKAAGYNKQAQDAYSQAWWKIEKLWLKTILNLLVASWGWFHFG